MKWNLLENWPRVKNTTYQKGLCNKCQTVIDPKPTYIEEQAAIFGLFQESYIFAIGTPPYPFFLV